MSTEGDQKGDELPERWWQTGYMRALFDFEQLAKPDQEGAYFRNVETIGAYTTQLKSLEKQYRLYGLLSFLAASLILAGGLPKDAKISLFGFEWPAALVTMQLTAVFAASCFGLAFAALGSLTILRSMLDHLLSAVPHGAEFVMAKFDASHLWANILRRRTIGYQTPWPLIAANAFFVMTGLLLLLLHIIIVGAALWTAFWSAWSINSSVSFPVLLSGISLLSFGATIVIFALGVFIPVPFKASKDMKEYWRKQAEEPTRSP